MKKVCASVAFALAVAFGTPMVANAQSPPVILDNSSQVVQAPVVYGGCQVQPYYATNQPVCSVRYYPSCTTVRYCSPVRYYSYPVQCSTVRYYTSSCCQPARRSWHRCCW
jgi:hypothetical protein